MKQFAQLLKSQLDLALDDQTANRNAWRRLDDAVGNGRGNGVATAAGAKGHAGPHDAPLMRMGVGLPLQITTTGGSAHGHVTIEIA